jgi:hypothetical protein
VIVGHVELRLDFQVGAVMCLGQAGPAALDRPRDGPEAGVVALLNPVDVRREVGALFLQRTVVENGDVEDALTPCQRRLGCARFGRPRGGQPLLGSRSEGADIFHF